MDSETGSKKLKPQRSRLRVALAVAGGLSLITFASAAWLIGTESGTRVALNAVENLSAGQLKTEGVRGALLGPLHIDRIRFENASQSVSLSDLNLDWQPRDLLAGTLHVTSLQAAKMTISSKLQPKKTPTLLPDRLDLPIDFKFDRVQIDRGEISVGPVNVIKLGTLVLNADYDGKRYRLGLGRFGAEAMRGGGAPIAGNLSGEATLSSTKPFALKARLKSSGQTTVQDKKIGADGQINIDGSLAKMLASIDMAIDTARVTGTATLQPFSDKPLTSTNINARAVDLSMLAAGMPKTNLDLTLSATDAGAGELAIRNTDAGLLNEKKLPVTAIDVSFRQDAARFTFDRIRAALGSVKESAGVIDGNGTLENGALTLALKTAALDLHRLDQRMQTTQLAGTVDVRHAAGKQDVTVSLSEPLNKTNTATLSAHASVANASIDIDRAHLKIGSGQIDATARADLGDKQAFSAEGTVSKFRLQDLGKFDQLPSLDLNGKFSLQGARQPHLVADLSFRITDSQLAGQPLHGEGKAQLRADSLLIPNLSLIAGDNQITAKGTLAQANGDISFVIAAPKLSQIGRNYGGSLNASGTVKGSFNQPQINAEWTGNQLMLGGDLVITAMQGKAAASIDRSKPLLLTGATVDATARGVKSPTLQLASAVAHVQFSPQPTAPLAIDIKADGISTASLNANSITVNAKGTTERHVLDIGLTEITQKWLVKASGGLQNLATAPQWQGTIDRFDTSGQFVGHLAAPASLTVSQQKVELDRFRLDANTVSIEIDQFLRDPRGIVTRGRFDKLKLADVLKFVGPQPALSTDLQLAGEWDVKLTDSITGKINVARQSGDVTMRGNVPVVLGLRDLSASLTATNGRIELKAIADGKQLGHIDVNASSTLARNSSTGAGNRFALAQDSAVIGSAKIDIPSIGWIAPFVSQSLIAEGSLQSSVSLGGTFGQPTLAGQINGNALRLFFTDLGLDLRQGTLTSEFTDSRLLVKNLQFRTDRGTLRASGPIGFAGGKPSAQIALVADKFALLDRSDRKLVLSGSSQIDWQEGGAKVTGNFAVDSGAFDIGQLDTPQLSDDVVVIGRSKKSAPKIALALDLGIDLGDGVSLKGRGINANLVGKLNIQTAAGEPLRATGTLQTSSGTFSAYGRDLAIEQGQLRFNGQLNNPSLNIVAMRRGQEVEAGVSVRGNVLAPRITLISEPTVPDAQKLSWLVLGRGLDAVGGSDLGALQSAAGALLSDGAAAGVQSQIATAFGLDDFRIGNSQDGLQSRIITLGKKVSAKLYVSYEQGLESASNVVHLRYTLSPHLTIEAEAGTRSALSLFYNIAFD